MGIRRKQGKHKLREEVDSLKIKINEIKTSPEYDSVRIGLSIFLVVLLVLGIFDLFRDGGADWNGILTEAHGMFMDILIFGVLLTWFEIKRSKKKQTQEYWDQLVDFWDWDFEEGVLRKVGIIKRLIRAGETSLGLQKIQLSQANLQAIDFSNANLTLANLSRANLSRVDLLGANLLGADFRGADLDGVRNLTCAQIKSAIIDSNTVFPVYLEITWADDGTYTCQMETLNDE